MQHRHQKHAYLAQESSSTVVHEYTLNRARAQDVVRQFDVDKSGSFDRKEVAKCLRSMGLELTDSEMRSYTKSLFQKLDRDGSNSIGFNEFFEFFQACLADETDRKKFLLQVQR